MLYALYIHTLNYELSVEKFNKAMISPHSKNFLFWNDFRFTEKIPRRVLTQIHATSPNTDISQNHGTIVRTKVSTLV